MGRERQRDMLLEHHWLAVKEKHFSAKHMGVLLPLKLIMLKDKLILL